MSVVDNAVYVDGRRVADLSSLDGTLETARSQHGMAWTELDRPDEHELRVAGTEFGLHPLAIEDALVGHQRAKLERYGDILFLVLRPARYDDATETVEFGEVHVFIGPDFVVTIRSAGSPDLGGVRRRLEAEPALLRTGPKAVLYAILDHVVDEYAPVADGIENDVDEIEDSLFGVGSRTHLTRRIHQLIREVLNTQRAMRPVTGILALLIDETREDEGLVEMKRQLRDVLDNAIRVADRADAFRQLLDNALTTNSAIIGQRSNEEVRRMTEQSITQNEQVKKISGWAAILFAPSLIGTIYGMNFRHMPELHWVWGYPFALVLMVLMGVGLWVVFRVRDWL